MGKTNRTVARNERYRKGAIGVRERHNERENEIYSNTDVLLAYSENNITFKRCEDDSYAQQFDRLEKEEVISTRGLKPDAYVFDELIFDVNTDYFEQHGGYEYAKRFYAEAYELAKEIAGGEQYIISAVMHADERNREASERLGKDVFHYHLHVVYLPVVEKEIRWSKRCKDPALRGTVREIVMQVSHSKKWPFVPLVDSEGNPVLKKDGRPRMVSSYRDLQTRFFARMKAAGFADIERGVEGSTAEHLDVLDYKIQQDMQLVQTLAQQLESGGKEAEKQRQQRDQLASEITAAEKKMQAVTASVAAVEGIGEHSKRKKLLKKVELPEEDYDRLKKMAMQAGQLAQENREMQGQLKGYRTAYDRLQAEADNLKGRLWELKQQTLGYMQAVRIAPERVTAALKQIMQEHRQAHRQEVQHRHRDDFEQSM